MGQLSPSISTKAGFEYLFSQSGYLNDPRRANTGMRVYETVVEGKHRVSRDYCLLAKVQKKYIDHWKNNSWDKEVESDHMNFLQLEKLNHVDDNVFYDEESDEDDDDEDDTYGQDGNGMGGNNENSFLNDIVGVGSNPPPHVLATTSAVPKESIAGFTLPSAGESSSSDDDSDDE
mgnify:CR=1 FL=1